MGTATTGDAGEIAVRAHEGGKILQIERQGSELVLQIEPAQLLRAITDVGLAGRTPGLDGIPAVFPSGKAAICAKGLIMGINKADSCAAAVAIDVLKDCDVLAGRAVAQRAGRTAGSRAGEIAPHLDRRISGRIADVERLYGGILIAVEL